jgi:polyisoprenoid-binding protein YceI
VRSSQGGVLPLTPFDRREIHRAMRDAVLRVDAYPEVRFVAAGSTGVRATGDAQRLKLRGDLTLVGQTHPATLEVTGSADGKATAVTAEARLKPSRWGIRQYTAFLGALKVKDDVLVRLELSLRLGG